MTANYLLLTLEDRGLDGALYAPFADGAGPNTVDVTDPVLATRRNLFTNPSAEVSIGGWSSFNFLGSVAAFDAWSTNAVAGSRSFRLLPTAGTVRLGMTSDPVPVAEGEDYAFRASLKGVVAGRDVKVLVDWVDASPETVTLGTDTTSHVVYSHVFTAPAGATAAVVTIYIEDGEGMAYSEGCFIDALMWEQAPSVGTYFDGDTEDGHWDGLPGASTSTLILTTYTGTQALTGVPGDLDGLPGLGWWVEEPKRASQRLAWPTAFARCVFRVARDPAVVSDDSGDPLADQVYNHGWPITERLAWYLIDTRKGQVPDYATLTWPPPDDLAVVPVTGTVACDDDGRGWHGMTAVTWPGAGVGVGTLRQLLSGAEGSTHKVAHILDLLAATSSGQRTTIGNNFDTNEDDILAAYQNLTTVLGYPRSQDPADPPFEPTSAQARHEGREALNVFLARAAVGEDLWSNSSLSRAVSFALMAITAKEAGLIGATFTTANYETMTGPIDAVLAMPTGY